MKKVLPWIAIVGALAVACVAANVLTVQFVKLEAGDFMSPLGAWLLFALLIQRTVEVSPQIF